MEQINKYASIDFYNKISALLKSARNKVVQTVNTTMIYTYFEIGRMIIEEVRKIALENSNDNPYNNGNGIQVVLPEYAYPCDGANTLIDYCAIVP